MSRSLVPLAAVGSEAALFPTAHRPRADFLAHLIAIAAHAPQTCSRRKVEPAEARAAYRAVGHWPTASGRTICRSL